MPKKQVIFPIEIVAEENEIKEIYDQIECIIRMEYPHLSMTFHKGMEQPYDDFKRQAQDRP